jgi:hypothetical protein
VVDGDAASPGAREQRAHLTTTPGKLQFAAATQEAAQQPRAVLTPTAETPVV